MKVVGTLVFLAIFAYASADCRCSADDIKIVLKDWGGVWGSEHTGRRVAVAQAVFADLFDHAPASKTLFKGVNADNPDSPEFKAHCIRVVNGLDQTLNLLNDPATLESALNHLSGQHAVRDGVTASAFAAISESFGRVLPQVIPDFNKDTWGSCFSKIVDGISAGLPA